MSLLSRIRSGTISLTRDLVSTNETTDPFTTVFNLENDPKVRDFLSDTDTYSLYKLDLRYQPRFSTSIGVHAWGRFTVEFNTDHVGGSTPDQSSSGSSSVAFKTSFPFCSKYSAGPFPISYNKLLYRQYNVHSSGKPHLPSIKIVVSTSGCSKSPIGVIFVDWVIKKYRDTVLPGGPYTDDPVDS